MADAILHIEKLVDPDYLKHLEPKPSFEIVIKKFITYIQYAIEDVKNKYSVITLLEVFMKMI